MNKRTKVRRAPEPSNILWENYGRSGLELWFRGFMSYFITFIVLVLCASSIYLLTVVDLGG